MGLRVSMWTFVTMGVLFLATLFFLVSFGTAAWVVKFINADDVKSYEGLWQHCEHRVYPPDSHCRFYSDMPDYLQATRVIMCIAMVGVIASWIVLIIGSLSSTNNKNRLFVFASIGCFLITAFLLMIAVVNVANVHQQSLSYSLYLSVFSLIFYLIAAITICPNLTVEYSPSPRPHSSAESLREDKPNVDLAVVVNTSPSGAVPTASTIPAALLQAAMVG